MLHNHLRNFTSHELVVHFNASNQTYYGTDGIDKLCAWIKIACYHLCGFIDTCHAVALGKGGIGGKQQNGCEKKMFLGHKSFLFCAERIG